jgi:cobalt transporter subunit CbtA
MNMAMLRRLLVTAMLSGLVAGLALTAIQQLQISGLILRAETYEEAAGKEAAAAVQHHVHDDTAAPHEHAHDAAAWEPENGSERIAFTALANVTMAVGFGLLLAAAIAISGKSMNWPKGLLWGLAGYAVFFLAPSLGLPPELPGTEAAPLMDRQLWWLMTAVMTAGGIALLAFAPRRFIKALGVALLVAPHIHGAPHPEIHASLAPEELGRSFIYATAMANAVFWLILGGLTGFLYRKFAAAPRLSHARA